MTNEKKQPEENVSRFKRFFRFVFVRNWELKITAIVAAVVLWMISVGF